MSQSTVLHVFSWDKKFFEPFRSFIHKHFADGRHNFIVHGIVTPSDVPYSSDTTIVANLLKNFIRFSVELHKADKIVLHCLFSHHLLYILAVQPWLLKKCYWVMWGADLYVHLRPKKRWRWYKDEFFRRLVIRRIGYLVNGTPGDVELARKWYGANGEHIRCFNYPSNIYKQYEIQGNKHTSINIQVGNSADPSNQHFEILEKLSQYKNEDIKLYAPLSYGDKEHAENVISKGKEIFGDKFYPLTEMLPFDQYLDFLASIDIAVFNHERQQAFGNAITLLGLGKKVFLNSESTLNEVFGEFDIKIYDIKDINIELLSSRVRIGNMEKVKVAFSEESLVQSLKKWIG